MDSRGAAFVCQSCRARLVLVRSDKADDVEQRGEPWPGAGLGVSVYDSGGVEESFIVLNERRSLAAGGPVTQQQQQQQQQQVADPGGATLVDAAPSDAAAAAQPPSQQLPPPQHPGMEESFVVLPGSSSNGPAPRQAMAVAQAADTSAAAAAAAAVPQQQQQQARQPAGGLNSKLDALAALFELASTATRVDHPLCLDCGAALKEEVAASLRELEAETAAYETALAALDAEPPAQDEATHQAELSRLRAAAAAAAADADAAAAALEGVHGQLAGAAAVSADLDSLEARFWFELGAHGAELEQHLTERDALLRRIEAAGQQLLLLQGSHVLNDAFCIWHSGPFGTISGLRLGRTPEIPVDWDEINAAWGQAVLLLHTMAQQCQLTFSTYRLLPMGSHPRIADRRCTYDLFGPVNKLWGGSYDRAMAAYLCCLKEFGDFAAARDSAEGRAQVFEFPFAIDGDKVGNYTIRLSMLNKDSKWTKALKLMLADLKVALQWMIQRGPGSAARAPQQLPVLAQEGPAHGSAASGR